jgi:plasmid stabilization system protein ParE
MASCRNELEQVMKNGVDHRHGSGFTHLHTDKRPDPTHFDGVAGVDISTCRQMSPAGCERRLDERVSSRALFALCHGDEGGTRQVRRSKSGVQAEIERACEELGEFRRRGDHRLNWMRRGIAGLSAGCEAAARERDELRDAQRVRAEARQLRKRLALQSQSASSRPP